eukprot:1069313-Pyramimonas_sp.AAC.1
MDDRVGARGHARSPARADDTFGHAGARANVFTKDGQFRSETLAAVRHPGIAWDIPKHFNTSQHTKGQHITFQDITRHSKASQDISRHPKTSQDAARHFGTP